MADKAAKPFPGRLILHVGDHKTGTTAVQSALTRGDISLCDGTLCYPLLPHRFNHNHLREAVARRGPRKLKLRLQPGGFGRIARIARRAKPDVTILSTEDFERANPRHLKQVLAQHFPVANGSLDIVAYLRPHPARIVSGLAETIKIGRAQRDPWRFLILSARLRLKYAARVQLWQKAFGSAYHARPFVPGELHDGSLFEDLFATALGPGRITLRDTPRVNESLSVQDLMRIHAIHQALPGLNKAEHLTLGWKLAVEMSQARTPDTTATTLTLDKALAERIRRIFRADAGWVDAHICAGRPHFTEALDKAVDTAPAARQSLLPADWLAPDEMRALQAQAREIAAAARQKGWQKRMTRERIRRILA